MGTLQARIQDLIGKMTLEEKIALTIGRDFWNTNGVERLGIAPIALNDGPHGVRKPTIGNEIAIADSYPATAKVALDPGESSSVRMTLQARDFMLYDSERQAWRLEGGEVEILVGPSSENLVLSARVKTKEDPQSAAPVFDRMSPLKLFFQYPQAREALIHELTGTPKTSVFLSGNEMFTSMPINKLAVFGLVTDEEIDSLIARVNEAFRR